MVTECSPDGLVEVGLSAFTMGVNVLEDKFDASTRPDIHMPLTVLVPTLLPCVCELVVEETAVFADGVTRGWETETVLVVTASPTGIPLEIIVAAREVSSFIGSKRSFFERRGPLIGVTVTDEPPLDGVLATAVGFRSISGVRVSTAPSTWFANLLSVGGNTGELLALLTASDSGALLLAFDALDFSALLVLTNFPPYPLHSDCFPFTRARFFCASEGILCLGLRSFVECILFSLLLCFFWLLSLCLSPNRTTVVVVGLDGLGAKS